VVNFDRSGAVHPKNMANSGRGIPPIRFGLFEADLSGHTLTKGGVRVRLQDKPFRVLAMLLSRPGEVVTREDLKHHLWPDDEYGEFDLGINTAVRKLRQALGDSAELPEFVETVPKYGYRFIHPLSVEGGSAASIAKILDPDLQQYPGAQSEPRKPATFNGVSHWRVYALGASIALLAAAVAWHSGGRESPRTWEQPRAAPLTSYPGTEKEPTLSPDGRQVAFVWNRGDADQDFDLFVKPVEFAGAPLRLTDTPENEWGPKWSPDGRWIAFHRRGDSDASPGAVWLISPLGGPERKFFEAPPGVQVGGFAWMRGESALVLTLERPDWPAKLVLQREDGSSRELGSTPSSPVGDGIPSVSPDGLRVAFLRVGRVNRALYSVSLDGRDLKMVAPAGSHFIPAGWMFAPLGTDRDAPAWTPDGKSLVISVGVEAQSELWRFPIDGGEPRSLGLGSNVGQPAFAANAANLAFVKQTGEDNLWRLDFRSGRAERILASTRSDIAPQISPDGNWIAFVSDRSGRYEIWVCSAAGSDCRQVTVTPRGRPGSPRWSPDGRRLAYDIGREEDIQIYVVDADGGQRRKLEQTAAVNTRPNWSLDGKWLFFSSVRNGERGIWKLSAAGGDAVRIASIEGKNPFATSDGRSVLFTGQDTPIRRREDRLWWVSVDGGEANLVTNRLFRSDAWAAAADGWVYFPELTEAPPRSELLVKRHNLATGGEELVAKVHAPEGLTFDVSPFNCFDVAPDGSWAIIAVREHVESDLMLIENFR
jgi:Tol biopolymer transport system component/DNA-binding winged helix-turn-helix (wHTH) protein